MNFSQLLILLSVFGLIGCSSVKKSELSEEEVAKTEKVIEMEKDDFVILQASQPTKPAWILDPMLGDAPAERASHRYFVSESSSANQRLCLRSAEARATSQIAREISQFMKNSYTEATQGEVDEATEYMEERLSQEAQAFIVGARTHKSFWEKRSYKKDLGAPENKVSFTCYALIKMSKDNLESAVKNAKKKLLTNLQNPEVKEKATKNLLEAEKAFSNLEN